MFAMLRQNALLSSIAVMLPLVGFAGTATAANISEYFNGYGAESAIAGKNGGTGWNSAWSNWATGYKVSGPNTSITSSVAGYSNLDNDPTGGAFFGSPAGAGTSRSFDGLTGTVWVSAVMQQTVADSGRPLLWLGTNTFVGINGASLDIRYNSNNTAGAHGLAGSPALMLVKMEVDYSGTNDRMSFWLNPNLTSGEGGLGTPTYTRGDGNVNNLTFSSVALAGDGSNRSYIDALRISNDLNGFTFVTTGTTTPTPEPSSLVLLALGGLAAVVYRRRRRKQKSHE